MKYEMKHQQISGGQRRAQGKVQNSFVKLFETKQKYLLLKQETDFVSVNAD